MVTLLWNPYFGVYNVFRTPEMSSTCPLKCYNAYRTSLARSSMPMPWWIPGNSVRKPLYFRNRSKIRIFQNIVFQQYYQMSTPNSNSSKKTPEINELEWDLIPVKISWKNIENKITNNGFWKNEKKSGFFFSFLIHVGNSPLKNPTGTPAKVVCDLAKSCTAWLSHKAMWKVRQDSRCIRQVNMEC